MKRLYALFSLALISNFSQAQTINHNITLDDIVKTPSLFLDDSTDCIYPILSVSCNQSASLQLKEGTSSWTFSNTSYPGEFEICLESECISIICDNYDMVPATFNFTSSTGDVFEIIVAPETTEKWLWTPGVEAAQGCSDVTACNFNPDLPCENYSNCTFDCYGCLDPEASNYDPNATLDNGQCCYDLYHVVSENPGWWIAQDINYISLGQGNSNEDLSFCYSGTCFNFLFVSDIPSVTTFSIVDENGDVAYTGTTSEFGYDQVVLSFDGTPGCTDVNACNFNPDAICNDPSLCSYECYGCLDPIASNYNEEATLDDGSCCYSNWYTIILAQASDWVISIHNEIGDSYLSGMYSTEISFCLEENSCFDLTLYNASVLNIGYIIVDSQGNVFATGDIATNHTTTISTSNENVTGCNDELACNYNPLSSCQTWNSCDYSCHGCTNPDAFNFDENATFDDNTCCVSGWISLSISQPGYCVVSDPSNGTSYSFSYPNENGFCKIENCFTFQIWTLSGAIATFSFSDNQGNILFSGDTNSNGVFEGSISYDGEITGCTNILACNYSPEATCDNGSCMLYCGGCTDSAALNYNPDALFEDGSCFNLPDYPNLYFQTIIDDSQEFFYIKMDMISIGNGAPYLLMNTFNSATTYIDENGEYYVGPIPCGTQVSLNLYSALYDFMQYSSTMTFNESCNINSIADFSEVIEITAYPNPTSGQIAVKGLVDGLWKAEIIDITGRIILVNKISTADGTLNLNLDEITTGQYILILSNDLTIHESKILVQK